MRAKVGLIMMYFNYRLYCNMKSKTCVKYNELMHALFRESFYNYMLTSYYPSAYRPIGLIEETCSEICTSLLPCDNSLTKKKSNNYDVSYVLRFFVCYKLRLQQVHRKWRGSTMLSKGPTR